jgi:hypothetical protein
MDRNHGSRRVAAQAHGRLAQSQNRLRLPELAPPLDAKDGVPGLEPLICEYNQAVFGLRVRVRRCLYQAKQWKGKPPRSELSREVRVQTPLVFCRCQRRAAAHRS